MADLIRNTFPSIQKNGIHLQEEFRKLERRIRLGLLVAFLILLAALVLYFQFQFHYTLKETSKLNLAAIAESQRNTVDLFLRERIFNLLNLLSSKEFSTTPVKSHIESYLESLRQDSDAFVDVGVLDDNGHQIGYAGPYPHLRLKDYSGQEWFINLARQQQSHYISDIYSGFRKKLHFTIAVKQVIAKQQFVLRATLDPDKFYLFLRTIHRGPGVESFIINREGLNQVIDPLRGQPFGHSPYIPPQTENSGARELNLDGQSVLLAHAWLKEVNWALIVSEPLSAAYAEVYRARRILFISSILVILMVIAALWKTTRMLIGNARDHAEKKEEMYSQLVHATKLASLGELATGVAHEINNPLAIIIATSGVIRDRLNPEFDMDNSSESIIEDLKTIDTAVIRARGITQQLLNYGRKNNPQPIPSNVNGILKEVATGVKSRELQLANITLECQLAPDLPMAMIDPDQFRQVIYNLLNNAGDAIHGSGKITMSSTLDPDQNLYITIADSGCGMEAQHVRRIFDPFYTTKEVGKGTGLGLSVSLTIIESMGGTIEVHSLPGAGSAFTIILPSHTLIGEEHEFTQHDPNPEPIESSSNR